MSADLVAGAPGLDHRGLLYTDRASLVAAALPWITAALAGGGGVVVVTDRATARELDGALPHADSARVLYPSPSAVAEHGSAAFTRNLGVWAASVAPTSDGRVVVLTQYAPGPAPGVDPSLTALPITLVCACTRGAGDAVLEAFHDEHAVVLDAEPATGEDATLEATVGDDGDLAALRRDVRRLAVGAGFDGSALDRTVLAVHEACVLGCRWLHRSAGSATPDPARGCWLEVRAGDGSLSAEVVVPGGAASTDAHGAGTTLAHVRHFCHEASVHDGARSRAIRVLALAVT